ncbi:phage/plasmid primase, P4 family [Actinomycetota bacterium]
MSRRVRPETPFGGQSLPDGTVWDIATWIRELFDQEGQEGLEELIWEILGAIVRPYVSWNKTAWFYSEKGNNGKGTLCSLMRNLVGPRAHTSIPLADLGKDFALEPALRVNAIIVDENDVGTYIDKAANLKTLVTNDVIQVNRKYRMPVAFQFFGLMVQCLNEMPRVKDKSESFYRRQLFVPFKKSFTGAERRYIKDDYLKRKEVLEYVLKRVLIDTEYYEFSEPVATKEVLAEYKQHNDPVRAFWADVREVLAWHLVPFTFLYDLYKAWFARFSPSGKPVAHNIFVKDLLILVEDDELFTCPDKNRKIRTSTLMNAPELLIAEYDLKNWMNTSYKGTDPLMRSRVTNHQPSYRGLLRRPAACADAHAARHVATYGATDLTAQD